MNWHPVEKKLPSQKGTYLAILKDGHMCAATFSLADVGGQQIPDWDRNIVAWAEHPVEIPDFSACQDWVSLMTRVNPALER